MKHPRTIPLIPLILCFTLGGIIFNTMPRVAAQDTDYLKILTKSTAPETLLLSHPDEVAQHFGRALGAIEGLRGEGMAPVDAIESALVRNGTDLFRRQLLIPHLEMEHARLITEGAENPRVRRLLSVQAHPELAHELLNYKVVGQYRLSRAEVREASRTLLEVQEFAPPLLKLIVERRAAQEAARRAAEVAHEQTLAERRRATEVRDSQAWRRMQQELIKRQQAANFDRFTRGQSQGASITGPNGERPLVNILYYEDPSERNPQAQRPRSPDQ